MATLAVTQVYGLMVDIVVVRDKLHVLDRADIVPFLNRLPIETIRVAEKDISLIGDGL